MTPNPDPVTSMCSSSLSGRPGRPGATEGRSSGRAPVVVPILRKRKARANRVKAHKRKRCSQETSSSEDEEDPEHSPPPPPLPAFCPETFFAESHAGKKPLTRWRRGITGISLRNPFDYDDCLLCTKARKYYTYVIPCKLYIIIRFIPL